MATKKVGFEGVDRSPRAKDSREKEQRRKPWDLEPTLEQTWFCQCMSYHPTDRTGSIL